MSTEVKLPLNEISAVCLQIQNDPTKLSCGLSLVTAVVHLQQEKNSSYTHQRGSQALMGQLAISQTVGMFVVLCHNNSIHSLCIPLNNRKVSLHHYCKNDAASKQMLLFLE